MNLTCCIRSFDQIELFRNVDIQFVLMTFQAHRPVLIRAQTTSFTMIYEIVCIQIEYRDLLWTFIQHGQSSKIRFAIQLFGSPYKHLNKFTVLQIQRLIRFQNLGEFIEISHQMICSIKFVLQMIHTICMIQPTIQINRYLTNWF